MHGNPSFLLTENKRKSSGGDAPIEGYSQSKEVKVVEKEGISARQIYV